MTDGGKVYLVLLFEQGSGLSGLVRFGKVLFKFGYYFVYWNIELV